VANTCSLVGRCIIVQLEKLLRAESRWTNPLNALQEVIHYSFIKFCVYRFSLWYEFLVHYALRVEKNYQHGLDAGPLEFQFLQLMGCLTNPLKTLSFSFRVTGKTPVLISHNNFVKKFFVCIGHHDNVLARCASIFPLLRCQGVWSKTCTQLSLFQILFQNLRNYSVGDVLRFCYHFWCDSMVIIDQISNSSNVYLSSNRFWMTTSLVIFYQLPSALKSRIPTKNVWSVQSLTHIIFCTNISVSVTERLALKQNFMATLFISTIHDV